MMKQWWLLLLMAVPCVSVRAERVTVETARSVAEHVLQGRISQAALPADLDEMYLFVSDAGFVVVAADDCVRPVLAYGGRWSREGDTLPAAVHEWLYDYCVEIAARRQAKVLPSAVTIGEWQQAAAGGAEPLYSVVVSPLITTTWDQSPYYNNQCPSGCVTGCVATATAQVMKYWQHPSQGTGSHSYTDGSHGTLSANFGSTTYQWNLMPNALSYASSSAAVNAVAKLMYHVGVATEMSYGSSSSATLGSYGQPTAVCAENALQTYFGYAHSMRHVLKASMDDSLWLALIDGELSASRPILYSGRDVDGGHAFVLDGRNNAGHYHFNWGWGGYCDGYYIMGQLNPSPGGTGGSYSSTYNLKNGALLGIRPAPTSHPTTCAVSVDVTDASHAVVSGTGTCQYGDTISLKVNTSAGYRFVRWSDGVHFNPRRMVADSAVSLTAVVEPINGSELVYYAGSCHSTSYGAGGSFMWGMKLTSDDLQPYDSIRAVQIFDAAAGEYELRLYRGGNSSPTTQVYSQTFTLSGSDTWVEIPLDYVQEVNTAMPMWVIFYNGTSNYPAAVTPYAGHRNGSMCASGSGSNWHVLSADYTFMVRARFSTRTPCVAVREEVYVEACDSYAWNGTTYTSDAVDSLLTLTAAGCDSTAVLHLTVNHSIDTIIYDTATDSYQWNGVTYDQSGSYTYNGVTASGCDSVVTLMLTILQNEGIDDRDAAPRILVYPNPVGERLFVEGVNAGAVVVMYDLVGRELLRSVADGTSLSIDVEWLAAGIYQLQVGSSLHRIVVGR